MITFEHVYFSYSDVKVLNDVSFDRKEGDFVGILGPNGGGKSTFLKLCLGLLKPVSGKVTLEAKKVSYIAQTTSLSDSSFPATVEEIVSLGLVGSLPSFRFKERKEKVEKILEEFNLIPLKKRRINELSGGQQQRVKIAKALVKDPDLIVLDEPDAGRDDRSHESLIEAIDKLHEKKKSILFVSHHPEDLKMADRIYFIEQGKRMPYQDELKRGHHHVDL